MGSHRVGHDRSDAAAAAAAAAFPSLGLSRAALFTGEASWKQDATTYSSLCTGLILCYQRKEGRWRARTWIFFPLAHLGGVYAPLQDSWLLGPLWPLRPEPSVLQASAQRETLPFPWAPCHLLTWSKRKGTVSSLFPLSLSLPLSFSPPYVCLSTYARACAHTHTHTLWCCDIIRNMYLVFIPVPHTKLLKPF